MLLPKILLNGELLDGEALKIYRDASCTKPFTFTPNGFPKHGETGHMIRGGTLVYSFEYNIWHEQKEVLSKYPELVSRMPRQFAAYPVQTTNSNI